MNNAIDLDRARRSENLKTWFEDCANRFSEPHRFPETKLVAPRWPLRSHYNKKLEDVNFQPIEVSLSHLDDSYLKVLRCFASEEALIDDKKDLKRLFTTWRMFGTSSSAPKCLLDVTNTHLKNYEDQVLQDCKNGASAADAESRLAQLTSNFVRLGRLGILQTSYWQISNESRKTLIDLRKQRKLSHLEHKASTLDRQVEALSDAMRAMLQRDERISKYDRSVLALAGVMMCAPSRINEPMCMSIDDVITVEDFAVLNESTQAVTELGRAHALLLQKGSKGASWGAKPALTFMISLLNLCVDVLKENGKRSRMLTTWYEENPDKLYLPNEIEYLRGTAIDRMALWKIANLTDREPSGDESKTMSVMFRELTAANKVYLGPNVRSVRADGGRNARTTVQMVNWNDLEPYLIERVKSAIATCRAVTNTNSYDGRISRMLLLFDTDALPFLPRAVKYQTLRRRLKMTDEYIAYSKKSRDTPPEPTIFQKLNLKILVDGVIKDAWIETHDMRRWLTTKALEAKDRLSDVLINQWAKRLSLEQLSNYDARSDTTRADQSRMPLVVELEDLSAGLERIRALEDDYGLKTDLVTTNDVSVSMTSMELIAGAVEDRPVARTSNRIIIIYPTRFGVCLHQHHETPCRAYVCLVCNEGAVVKGHLPTNEEIRRRDALLFGSIVTQLDRLITAHSRGIADFPEGLENHMLTLVGKGLDADSMGRDLIDQFHEIKERIKNPSFKHKLEEAFVARGIVRLLDSDDVQSGALIRYHNPGRHSSPGHERALDAHGGRDFLDKKLADFHTTHPRLAPEDLRLKDGSDGVQPDADDVEPDEDDADE